MFDYFSIAGVLLIRLLVVLVWMWFRDLFGLCLILFEFCGWFVLVYFVICVLRLVAGFLLVRYLLVCLVVV